MGHLGQGTEITTVQDKEIVLTSIDGHNFRMKIDDLAEAVRKVMKDATVDSSGLMPASFFGKRKSGFSSAKNRLLIDYTTTSIVSFGLIISASPSGGNQVSLYYMSVSRTTAIASTPTVILKLLSGSDSVKFKMKYDNTSGRIRIIQEKSPFTSGTDALLLSPYSTSMSLSMIDISDDDMEGSTYISLI